MFFLIWTLVTGFFGQNFGYLTESHRLQGSDFFVFEIGALLIPTIILAAVSATWRRKRLAGDAAGSDRLASARGR